MAGRPKIFDEEQALDKAIAVFWEKGYENASAENLLKAMGIGKGSFYHSYKGGKQELFEKSVNRVGSHYMKDFKQALRDSARPTEEIRKFFYAVADPESQFGKFGCYFVNAVLQVDDEHLKCVAANQLDVVRQLFMEAIDREKNAGYLKTALSTELIGLHLQSLWAGVNVIRNAGRSAKEVREVIKLNLEILE
ncbi:TetR/AcrR family transcriptional regulator [Marinoscillum sp. 108]|jgi:TetR/AcrR family transcriptional regulator, transcriptional repressor for nem operon|uniref:TetR/AcrR family transcriptional regulator n=1 Tax=Marinoscillum sp. 108 TaxID=2653151 RepID=UPI0012EF9568|nr:TetR/AcrR family transcriptional regulator [Marinoscillum sp. 108]VXD14575.1 TetR/AcrR family transcriptional regulator [Marinoscillum sp. 108]